MKPPPSPPRRKNPNAGRPKGSPNRKTEKRHREIAARVDAIVAKTGRLKAARMIVAESDFVVGFLENPNHPEGGYPLRWQPCLTTVRTAHKRYGLFFGRGGKNIPYQ
jgi:hypothetical protein